VSPASPSVGEQISIKFDNKQNTSPLFVAYYSGLNVFFSDVGSDGTTIIPSNLTNAGTVYASVVSSKNSAPTDKTTLSGLAILYINFDSAASQ
jgi:hypothetical protein